MVQELVGTKPINESAEQLLDQTVQFLRDNFVPPLRVPPYMWEWFIDQGGVSNTWLQLSAPPERSTAQIRHSATGPGHQARRRVGFVVACFGLGPSPDTPHAHSTPTVAGA